jgi:hypothetical protein
MVDLRFYSKKFTVSYFFELRKFSFGFLYLIFEFCLLIFNFYYFEII